MHKIIEAVRAVCEAAAADLVLEEGHEKIDPQDYEWFVHDLGVIAMKSKRFIEKIKYAEVKE